MQPTTLSVLVSADPLARQGTSGIWMVVAAGARCLVDRLAHAQAFGRGFGGQNAGSVERINPRQCGKRGDEPGSVLAIQRRAGLGDAVRRRRRQRAIAFARLADQQGKAGEAALDPGGGRGRRQRNHHRGERSHPPTWQR